MAVHSRLSQAIGLDGIFQLVGVIPSVPVYREGIQEPGKAQHLRLPEGPQKIVEKIQIELGVVGHQERPFRPFQQAAEGAAGRALVHAFPVQLFRRDTRQVCDERRQTLSRRQTDQGIQAIRLPRRCHADGSQFDDLVPAKFQASGLRVEHHDPVKQ